MVNLSTLSKHCIFKTNSNNDFLHAVICNELHTTHPQLIFDHVLPILPHVLDNVARHNPATMEQVGTLRQSAAGLMQALEAIMGDELWAWIDEENLESGLLQTLDELMQLGEDA